MPDITPCLWFKNGQAETAATVYTGLLPDSRIDQVVHADEGLPFNPEGSVLSVAFTLQGRPFLALNGGPAADFTPAVSLVAYAQTQDELDRLWGGLLAGGGRPLRCGWLTDRFGLSWQVLPARVPAWLQHPDKAVRQRVTQALMQMVKLDMAVLTRAAGEELDLAL